MPPEDLKVVDDTPNAPISLHQYVTYRIARVHAKLNAQASRILREASGVTVTQWRVIALTGVAGTTRLSVLARESALDKGLLSRNLKTLIADGIVSARVDEHDHRAQILKLTAKGQEIFEKTLPVTQVRQRRLQADISEEEMRVFRNVLDKLEVAAEA
ncbi:MarR family winged helix-turn-helix transcriptional regulator [Marinovum sp. 2_MG-2023]|uniref:MarR family winged helix-turn-helix transcriptional regulator n=1 Tax=Roseobacteraceae TaxID=2854170 RepID=UPI001FD588BD|nr:MULTISPECIES: MarR family winged helix-turn-helix transcriptional regulator [Roseobacteraceae]MCJ7872709.1 MarR family winged helix-turn-helix transcriptional regulator [Phaeobacter sp. J2-8]MDO6729921.1 MarR family winged helix-turn-helix transcriptional regulator [Marinovum sp. 2_MG-2023]MDO6779735.1 MarR family winged helix-turn-helix transcriptional regulator [Marinovum sp. 1_MG-2023]